MNKIKKLNLFFILIVLFSFSPLNAAKKRGEYATKNIVGQEYYLKNCSSCHGEGSRGGNMASINEWKELFSKNASELLYLHEEDEELKGVVNYLKGENFKKQSELMLKFLQEFAYDSQNVPTCN